MNGPRIATERELLIGAAAVIYLLVWIVCAVLSIENVRGEAPQFTDQTVAPAVVYQPEEG